MRKAMLTCSLALVTPMSMIGASPHSPSQPLALPGRKTASGGLGAVPRLRAGRWALQPTDAPGKMRPGYGGARRRSHLPQSPICPTGSVGEIRRNLPSKGVGAQIADGVSSYIQGVAWGATALATRAGLLGSGAQQQAINTNGQLGQVLGQIQSHPGQTASFVGAVVSKYPVQVASRIGSGVVVSVATSPYVGVPVTGLAAYGTAFKEAYQHPDVVAAAVIVGQSCR